jgi:hypothetical protein
MFTRLSKNCINHILISLFFLLISATAYAQGSTTSAFTEQAGATAPAVSAPVQLQSCREAIPGNGGNAGYLLSHGNIIADSVVLSVDGRTLHQGTDYNIDSGSGSLFFNDPVRLMSTINVSYQYDAGAKTPRSALSMNSPSLNILGSSLNFGLGISSSGGMDFNTYGMNMASKLGGAGNLTGMVYFSNPASNKRNMIAEGNSPFTTLAAKQQASTAKSDHFIMQNFDAKTGKASFHANFQDIGQSFSGFEAMSQGQPSGSSIMSQLTSLEKQKGIQKLGFGGDLQTGKTGGLSFDWNRVHDNKDQIVQQKLGYQATNFALNLSSQSIGNNFSRFADLSDPTLSPLAAQKGLSRTDLSMALGSTKSSYLQFNRSGISNGAGNFAQQSINLGSKGLSFSFGTSQSANTFNRFQDLSDSDKTSLALAIHRQFDPNAQVGAVTALDKTQLVGEMGLQRQHMDLNTMLGKTGQLAISQFGINDRTGGIHHQSLALSLGKISLNWMDQSISSNFTHLASMSNFEKTQFGNEVGMHRSELGLKMAMGKTGSLALSQMNMSDQNSGSGYSSQNLDYTGGNLQLSMKFANTDENFTRAFDLAGLTPMQKAGIAAERGYKRTDLNAVLKLNKTSNLTISNFSMTGKSDSVSLQQFHYTAKSLNMHLGLSSVGKDFQQAMSLDGLSVADKQTLQSEIGFNRTDFGLNYTGTKGLSLSTYTYNATDPADKMNRSNWKHNLVWDRGPGLHVNLLSEGNVNFTNGLVQNGMKHDLISLDMIPAKNMKLNMYHDTLANGGNDAWNSTTDTNYFHFENNQGARQNYMADLKQIDYGNGHFEKDSVFDMHMNPMAALAFHFSHQSQDRGNDPSVDVNSMDYSWKFSPALQMSGLYSMIDTNNNSNAMSSSFKIEGMATKTIKLMALMGNTWSQNHLADARTQGFGISGPVGKTINLATTYSFVQSPGQPVNKVVDLAVSNAKPCDLMGVKEMTFTAKVAQSDNLNKKVEQVTGQIAGTVAKTQIAMGYTGSLSPVPNGKTSTQAIARSLEITTDKNVKKPFHMQVLYKARNINWGDLILVRKYAADYRIMPGSTMNWSYVSFPEDQVGNVQQTKTSDFALTQTLTKDMNMNVHYATANNIIQRSTIDKLGASFTGKLDKLSDVQVGYDADLQTLNGHRTNSNTFHFAYNTKVDADHYLSVSTSYGLNSATAQNGLATNLDFKTIF